jgi:integrase
MKAKITVLFYIKRTKTNKLGQCPIFVRITVDGKRTENSTGMHIDAKNWSSKAGKSTSKSDESKLINEQLEIIKNKIFNTKNELQTTVETITVDNLKNKLFGIEDAKRMLIPIFQDHNNRIDALLGQEYALGTLKRYKTSLKHTQDFLQWKYNISDLELDKIDHALICDYEFYLRSVRKCANNSAVKYIKNFKKIVKQCMANGWINSDPFANYKSKIKEVERVFLTEQEINKIVNKKFVSDRLSIVRDLFLFSCFTGLAYVDLKNLTKQHISKGIDGEQWIFTHRQKTESASKIPLLPTPQEIINKYQSFATVMQNGHVQLSQDKNYYSVPYQYVKKKAKLLYTKSTVEIYHKYNRIAIHIRNYKPYIYTTNPEHLASTHQFVAQWSASRFIEWGNSIDATVGAYILKIIESRNHPEQAYKSCLGILHFEKKVGKERLINACKRALDFKIYNFKTIQNILENNLDSIDFEHEQEQDLPTHGNIRGKHYFN